jgi:protein-S-isoprenylcysteine O-methyltransferase Ste14
MKMLAKLLIGIIIFIGIPLVAWGINDISGFFGNPARVAYVVLTVIMQVVIVVRIPDAGSNRNKGSKRVGRQHIALILLQIIGLAIVIIGPYCDRREIVVLGDNLITRGLGCVLYIGGMFLMHRAESYLAELFSVEVAIRDDHRLITNGPYRFIRHPRYLGIIVFSVGASLIFRSWLSLIAVAALVMVLLWRIYDEEGLMHEHFGTDWESYRDKSWRLIPYIF